MRPPGAVLVTTTLFLVRHASHGLLGRVLTGRMAGVSLSEAGRAEAERLAGRLAREGLTRLQSSPSDRARETAARIAAATGLAVEVEPALDEIDYGDWMGRDFDTLDGDPAWARWNSARGLSRPPGGEAMWQVEARVLGLVERLRSAGDDARVALVSHGDVIKAALLHHLGLTPDAWQRIEIGPASVSVLAIEDWGARVLSINEAARP
jgi:broad specificity phosphatase PhoE